MIKNLSHAILGVALIFGVGWLLAQPSAQKPMGQHRDARYAVAGILIALALFVVASLWRAFRGGRKPAPRRPGVTPYSVTAKRR